MLSNETHGVGLRARWWRLAVSVVVLCELGVVPASAKLKIVGTAADRTKLQGMLQQAAYGTTLPAPGTVNIDAQGNITLSGNAPTNAFGTRLKMVIDDATNTVELHAEKTAPNAPAGRNDVLVGGWARGGSLCDPGNGMQSIDLMDLMMLSTKTGEGGLNQQAALIHEIIETWVGVKDMKKFKKTQNQDGTRTAGAHCDAIDAESAVISESMPGMTFRRVLDQQRALVKKLPDGSLKVLERLIIFIYEKVGTNEKRATIIHIDVMNGKDDDGDGMVDEADEVGQVTGSETRKVQVKRQRITTGGGGSSGGLGSFDEVGGATSFNDVLGTLELGGAEYLRVYEGNLYASLPIDGIVVRVNEQTGEQDVVFSDAELVRPHGFALDEASGEFFVADADDNQIVVFDRSGTFLRTFSDSCLDEPAGVDVDMNGNLLVASHFGGEVCHLSPSGTYLGSFDDPGMGDPAGVVYDASADILFVVDNTNGKVWQFAVDGSLVREFVTGGLTSPWGIDIEGGRMRDDEAGGVGFAPLRRVMVADSAGSIQVYDAEGTPVDSLSQSGVSPMAVAFRAQVDLFSDGFESGDTSAWSATVP